MGSQGTFPLAIFPFLPPTVPLSHSSAQHMMFDACLILLESCLEKESEFFLSPSRAISFFQSN